MTSQEPERQSWMKKEQVCALIKKIAIIPAVRVLSGGEGFQL